VGKITLKAGWFSDYRERTYDTKVYTPYVNNPAGLADDLRPFILTSEGGLPGLYHNAESIFNPRNYRADGSGWNFADESGFDFSPSYTASNEQHAGYAAVNVPLLGNRLNVYGGLRAEWNRLQSFGAPYLTSRDPGDGNIITYDSLPTTNQERLYWLPSVNVSYRLTPRVLLRAAYGKTLNRPEFREVGPVTYYDFEKAAFHYGNVTLTNAEIQNVDLRLEWYPKEDELLSVGAFFKDLRNPIEAVSAAAANFSNDAITYLNTSGARVYGLEAEVRKRLDFVPLPGFRHLSVIANATWLRSRVELSDSVRFLNNIFRERPLQGSAPYTLNAGLYYDNEDRGTQVSALYNVLGQRLTAAATALTAFSLYELPRHVVDLTVTQRVTRFLQLKAGVQDVLNQPYRFFRDVIPDEQFKPNQLSREGQIAGGTKFAGWTSDYLEERYRPGSYFSFGVLLTF
jgi:TonB-dependent receptor